MTDKFYRCLNFVLKWEGGLTDDPDDPGGRTSLGVTQARYNQYRKDKGLPLRDVALMTDAEMREIYWAYYWQPIKGDEFVYPLALAIFDTGVNMGTVTAIKLLQRAINDLVPQEKWIKVDGVLGQQTLTAAKSLNPVQLALRLCDRREERYRAIVRANPKLGKFLKGWLNRLNDLRKHIKDAAQPKKA
jgi:lysozyme family protein